MIIFFFILIMTCAIESVLLCIYLERKKDIWWAEEYKNTFSSKEFNK